MNIGNILIQQPNNITKQLRRTDSYTTLNGQGGHCGTIVVP